MTETGMSEVLQNLIDTLQIEGHELFRVFAEVQMALAIQGFLIVIGTIIGCAVGIYAGYKISGTVIRIYNVDSYDEGMTKICLLIGGLLVGLITAIFLIDATTALYIAYQYPEYYAAKELINSIAYMS